VDPAKDFAEFLSACRSKVTPEQAGLPAFGPRRVSGLRREEVASLAGVSVDYYRRLERGLVAGVSDAVLDALADALRVDEVERTHLHDLARAVGPVAPRRRRVARPQVRPIVQQIVDGMSAPAIVRNVRDDYLSANALGRALFAPVFESPEQPVNGSRFIFLDPAARGFYADWDRVARDVVGYLRSVAGANPYDRELSDLVGQLTTRSPEFASWWSAHTVRFHNTGRKRLNHPVVGELELVYEVMELSADSGLTIAVYNAEQGSRSEQALNLLASWAATPATDRTAAT
jgi:transcriptional regulator with XRE-family HTH domain